MTVQKSQIVVLALAVGLFTNSLVAGSPHPLCRGCLTGSLATGIRDPGKITSFCQTGRRENQKDKATQNLSGNTDL